MGWPLTPVGKQQEPVTSEKQRLPPLRPPTRWVGEGPLPQPPPFAVRVSVGRITPAPGAGGTCGWGWPAGCCPAGADKVTLRAFAVQVVEEEAAGASRGPAAGPAAWGHEGQRGHCSWPLDEGLGAATAPAGGQRACGALPSAFRTVCVVQGTRPHVSQ